MEHLAEGDTIFIRVGNSALPALVVYSGPRFYSPLYKMDTEVIFKSRSGWSPVISCSKQMYGGDHTRMVLVEKTMEYFKK